jgi:hypothetical protein
MMMGEEGTLMKRCRHTPEQIIRKLREARARMNRGAHGFVAFRSRGIHTRKKDMSSLTADR